MDITKYEDYKKHFLIQDFYECHEIYEEYWKATCSPLTFEHPFVILVQVAVIMEHLKRGNYTGARKLINKTTSHYQKIESLNLDYINEVKFMIFFEKLNLMVNDENYYYTDFF
jgi:hypothetical protein